MGDDEKIFEENFWEFEDCEGQPDWMTLAAFAEHRQMCYHLRQLDLPTDELERAIASLRQPAYERLRSELVIVLRPEDDSGLLGDGIILDLQPSLRRDDGVTVNLGEDWMLFGCWVRIWERGHLHDMLANMVARSENYLKWCAGLVSADAAKAEQVRLAEEFKALRPDHPNGQGDYEPTEDDAARWDEIVEEARAELRAAAVKLDVSHREEKE